MKKQQWTHVVDIRACTYIAVSSRNGAKIWAQPSSGSDTVALFQTSNIWWVLFWVWFSSRTSWDNWLECEGDKNPLMCCSKIQSMNSYCMSDSPLVDEGWQWYWGTELPLVEAGTVKEEIRRWWSCHQVKTKSVDTHPTNLKCKWLLSIDFYFIFKIKTCFLKVMFFILTF